jgi:hypothetical protein
MSVDINVANELLNKKYNENETRELNETMYSPKFSSKTRSDAIASEAPDWKFIANERLQMLEQTTANLNGWYEAYCKEKERADKFEKLFLEFILSPEAKLDLINTEIKHTVSSPQQVNRRRANWPSVKKFAENKYAAHDAGFVLTQEDPIPKGE